jgi:hypothetical protein
MEVIYHRFQGQKGTGSAYNELIWEIPDNSKTKPTMIFDREIRVQKNPFAKRNQAWRGIA